MADLPVCKHEGCEDPVRLNAKGVSTGYCAFHRGGGGWGKTHDVWERWPNKAGYMRLKLPSGDTVIEHRWLMEQHLGRPLVRGETIHHKNGDHADNRLENLELWWSQPYGQRVEDLLHYVIEIHSERLREMLATEARNSVSGQARVERDWDGG